MDECVAIFPEDVVKEILLRCPVKSLLRFTCINKNWYALIKTPEFVQHHLNCSKNKPSQLLLYNSGNLLDDHDSRSLTLLSEDNPQTIKAIYSCSRDSWRIFKPKKPLPLFIDVKHTFGTAYLNGAYYWLLNGGSRTDYSILSFDFGCEIFEGIEGCDCHFVDSSVLGMMLLDDSIAILNSNIDERFAYDIWVMIQPGIWNKRVTFQCYPKIKSCYDSSLILATKASRLVSYNVLTNKTRHHGFQCSCLSKHPLYGGCGFFIIRRA
ncbi:hypothetical protein H5410_057365 [Solanum commersonii]|uniref:F-box domain-containing protein n=1 Tax=Solanum commersonii TaxID=4109 RepID=A0A9J5WPV6_SOLCO|nr:hypothetical protein H5410_057365 [Solanum commersonii]